MSETCPRSMHYDRELARDLLCWFVPILGRQIRAAKRGATDASPLPQRDKLPPAARRIIACGSRRLQHEGDPAGHGAVPVADSPELGFSYGTTRPQSNSSWRAKWLSANNLQRKCVLDGNRGWGHFAPRL